jgi:hypothetical protein
MKPLESEVIINSLIVRVNERCRYIRLRIAVLKTELADSPVSFAYHLNRAQGEVMGMDSMLEVALNTRKDNAFHTLAELEEYLSSLENQHVTD